MRRRSTRGDPRGPNKPRWCDPTPGCATHARLLLERLMTFVLISDWRACPKNPYIETPRGILARSRRRNMKPQNRGWTYKNWRGKRCQSCPRPHLQPLQHHQHRHYDEDGVVYLWTMGLWRSLIYLSLALCWLDAIWAAYHDYDHII
jgi:hypothetical protein